MMNVLGIETSCDETSVAIISGERLTSNLISSQDFHRDFGGVVPELSSRAHLQILKPLLEKALSVSKVHLKEIDIICATAGPGLIGALLVGLTFAKGLSFSLKKPFIGVNHIEGHIFSGFLMEHKPEFPFIAMVVSGGHTLLLYVKSYSEIIQLGTTVDDAAGEAFDKVAKLLGLGYPGGAKIQELAEKGNADEIVFPVASLNDPFNFSFSGVKTAVLRYIQKKYSTADKIPLNELNNIAASFQKAVVTALVQKCEKAIQEFNKCNSISLTGGVAANKSLRSELSKLANQYHKKIIIPDIRFCGDNAAMIALRGKSLFESGVKHSLDYSPYPSLKENQFLSYQ